MDSGLKPRPDKNPLGHPKGVKYMRAYEITAILKEGGTLVEDSKKAIKEILTKHSAEITGEEDMGQRKLWHRIGNHEYGHFALIKFNGIPSSIKQIENELFLNQNILRSLIVRA